MPSRNRPSIDELEELIEKGEDDTLEILPNGDIRYIENSGEKKPLTFKEKGTAEGTY